MAMSVAGHFRTLSELQYYFGSPLNFGPSRSISSFSFINDCCHTHSDQFYPAFGTLEIVASC